LELKPLGGKRKKGVFESIGKEVLGSRSRGEKSEYLVHQLTGWETYPHGKKKAEVEIVSDVTFILNEKKKNAT